MAIVTKKEAYIKISKLDIPTFKKEIIFYNIFEYELKEFMETEKNTKNLKTLVNILVSNNAVLEDVKKILIHKDDVKIYDSLYKIGRIDNNYILYIDIINTID